MERGRASGRDSSSSVSPSETIQKTERSGQLRCAFPGCGKTFTRKDHLIRHAANHSQPNYHCGTCGRSFQRLDLLQRHERRQICDDERYPKRLKTDPAAAQIRQPAQPVSTVSPQSAQSANGADRMYMMHHAQPPQGPQPQSQPQPQPPIGIDDSFHRDVFPVMDLQVMSNGPGPGPAPGPGPGPGPAPPPPPTATVPSAQPAQPELDSAPIAFEPQAADFGFGLWPPDPWEALLQDTLAPSFWDESSVPDTQIPWSLAGLLGSTTRTQESAERRGSATAEVVAPYGGTVGQGLLQRLMASWPELGMSMPELSEALALYWSEVAPSFPFIHRGTFDVDTAPAELVVMMAVTGMVRGTGPTARRDFRRLVQRIRARLVEDRFGLELELSTLQAFTLCHVYDVWHGDTETLFVAQCMWPVVVAHSRKQGIGVSGAAPPDGHGAAAWYAWAKDEERRRAAYSILFIDTQMSSFWSQHPSRQLSIFAHNINLPCTRSQWDAPTAADWLRIREQEGPAQGSRRINRQGYLPGLHPEFQVSVVSEGYSSAVLAALAADGAPPIPVDLDNSLGVMMVLTGLCAIAWDCRTRGGMGIRFRDGTKHWRSIVLNAVVSLRAAFELGVNHIPLCVESRDIRDQLALSIISILSDIPMLQVAAGATNICGASIGPKQFADSKRRLRLWVATQDAWTCLWQSARYLREAMFADWGLYSPWAVFLTTLVVWAYATGTTREDHAPSYQPPHDNPHASATGATALLDSIYMSPSRVESLDARGVADLVVTVAAKLKQAQPIDRDNAQLLWRLAGRSVPGGPGTVQNVQPVVSTTTRGRR